MPDSSRPLQPPRRRSSRKPVEESPPAVAVPLVDRLEEAVRHIFEVLMAADTPPGAKAALLREYRMAVAALEARPKAKGSKIDELAARRKARRSAG